MKKTNLSTLKKEIQLNENLWLLLYKEGSAQSSCAYDNFVMAEQSVHNGKSNKTKNDFFCFANVNEVRDIHQEFKITSVPALLHFEKGQLKNIVKGCHQPEQFYHIFERSAFKVKIDGDEKPQKRVTVYTTPTCTWCTTVKRHLDEHGVQYREVDITRDPKVADELVKRSGQQGVPQTDINGEIVVGFDKNRINSLLGIN